MTVPEQLTQYLKEQMSYISSGTLQKMDWKNEDGTLATPRSVVRRLQELVEDGTLAVENREKNHAYYRYAKGPIKKVEYVLEFRDGVPVRVTRIVLV